MSRIDLHIGMHKTGTTSIQLVLRDNAAMLRESGILYPETGRMGKFPEAMHHDLAAVTRRQQGPEEDALWAALSSEIASSGLDRAILSSELFCEASPGEVARVRRHLDGHDVRIIVYLRNQYSYMVSRYKQFVKDPSMLTDGFGRFLEERADLCNYKRLLDLWASEFSRDAVTVRIFEKADTKGGVIDDFASLIGIAPESLTLPKRPRWNISPADDAITALRVLNRLERSRLRHVIPRRLCARLRDSIIRGKASGRLATRLASLPLIPQIKTKSPEHVRLLERKVADWNEALFAEWLQPGDEAYFSLAGRP